MTIDDLITEGSKFKVKSTSFHVGEENGINIIYEPTYYIEDGDAFTAWIEKSKRYIASQFPNDRAIEDFEKYSKEFSSRSISSMVAILKSLKDIPTPCPVKPKENSGVVVSVSQSQTQQQSATFVLDSIKDALTGSQLKEIQTIAKEEKNPDKAKTKIIDKLKSFGGDVLSNIVANLITNPNLWSQFV